MTDNLPAEVTDEKTPNLLSVIARAAADPAVDVMKMEALLRLQREIMADQAKASFYASLTRLTGKIPPVKKNGRISLGNNREVSFAKFEDMMPIINPLLREEGMAITFTSRSENNELVVVGSLVHELGFSISAEMALPYDIGPGRNLLQARGSSRTYGQRYITDMLLNIVREGQDDDGAGGVPAATRRGRAPAGFRPQQAEPAPKIDASAPAEPADERLLQAARSVALQGSRAFRHFYSGLSDDDRLTLRPDIRKLQDDAKKADNEQNPAALPPAGAPSGTDAPQAPPEGATSRDPVDYLNA